MKEYDLERIKECVSMEDICDILGIEKRRIGGLTSVLSMMTRSSEMPLS